TTSSGFRRAHRQAGNCGRRESAAGGKWDRAECDLALEMPQVCGRWPRQGIVRVSHPSFLCLGGDLASQIAARGTTLIHLTRLSALVLRYSWVHLVGPGKNAAREVLHFGEAGLAK